MIIVSQDRKSIFNFDNVSRIYVNKFNNEIPDIRCDTTNDLEINLGDYETEERAKEVLQEIMTAYEDFNYLKFFPENITESVEQFMHRKYKYFDTYEMPEE